MIALIMKITIKNGIFSGRQYSLNDDVKNIPNVRNEQVIPTI